MQRALHPRPGVGGEGLGIRGRISVFRFSRLVLGIGGFMFGIAWMLRFRVSGFWVPGLGFPGWEFRAGFGLRVENATLVGARGAAPPLQRGYFYSIIYIHIYTYKYIYIYTYIYIYIHINIYTYIHIWIYIYTFTFVSIHIYTYIHKYLCVCVCAGICM